jgi:hypothetical protein
LTKEAVKLLQNTISRQYSGLANLIERAVLIANSNRIDVENFPVTLNIHWQETERIG